MSEILTASNLKVRIKDKEIINDFSYSFEKNKVYSIIGPNGSGKTTLIRVLSRNLKPVFGDVQLFGQSIFKQNTKEVAKKLSVLSQTHTSSTDLTVRELITYGRFCHKQWWQGSSEKDVNIIDWAVNKTGLENFQHRKINTLSGGERQRAWIAMSIAQKPSIMILDEPTTFLDIGYQLELLELINNLNKEEKITIIMVLHDINQAVRYSDEIIVVKNGELLRSGSPWDIVNNKVLEEVFNVHASVSEDKETGKPIFYPLHIKNKAI